VSGFDLADAERGVLIAADPAGTAVVFKGNEVLAAGRPDPAADPAADEDGLRFLDLDGVRIEVELTPIAEPVRLQGPCPGIEELTVCRALGSLHEGGGETEIACLAVRRRSLEQASGAPGVKRSVAVAFADGGLLALSACRAADAEGHGEETISVALTDPEGELPLEEALISTEYDEQGRHRRATVELSLPGAAPLRGAGTIVSGATLETEGRRVEIAFFRWSLNGRPGLGRYEIVTAR
jgi:hypothetical protein